MKKKHNPNKAVIINKDVWFYRSAKSFSFVVWAEVGGQKKAVQFRLTDRKLKKFL